MDIDQIPEEKKAAIIELVNKLAKEYMDNSVEITPNLERSDYIDNIDLDMLFEDIDTESEDIFVDDVEDYDAIVTFQDIYNFVFKSL